MSKNLYEVLRINRFADQHEIKRAFRKLLVEKHPDRNLGDLNATKLFMRITEAYEVLRDPTKKQLYDREINNVDSITPICPTSYSWSPTITNPSIGTFLWEAFDQNINMANDFDEHDDLFLQRKFGNTSDL
jgi:curved DNA-binding protein CbpA